MSRQAGFYPDMLNWVEQPRMARSASASALISGQPALTEEELAAWEVLKEQKRKTRTLNNPQMKDHVRLLMAGQGKQQHKGMLSKTRVRKDFRDTNATQDIPGAMPIKMMGRTSTGFHVNPDRADWPYAKALPQQAEDVMLFEEIAAAHRLKQANAASRSSFEEQVYKTSSVETHLTIPGVGLKVVRKELKPLFQERPPPARDATYAQAIPANSIHYRPELREVLPHQTTVAPWRSPHARMGPTNRMGQVDAISKPPRPEPAWRKPAMDPPRKLGAMDRSLSTDDIAGAKPRRLVSVEARHSGFR